MVNFMRIFFTIFKNFGINKYKAKIFILYFATLINLFLEVFSLSLIIPIIGVLLNSTLFEYKLELENKTITIDRPYVEKAISEIAENIDLTRYIL